MDLRGKTTSFMVIMAVLWLIITVMGWKGYWLAGMILGLVLMLIHMVLGCAHKGKLNTKFLVYPLLCWLVLWAVSFVLSYHYGKLFAGEMPDFTILGFHPSFAWTVLTYWIGGVLTLNIGFILYRDLWLSDDTWEEFREKVARVNEEEGGVYSDVRS